MGLEGRREEALQSRGQLRQHHQCYRGLEIQSAERETIEDIRAQVHLECPEGSKVDLQRWLG